MRKLEDFLQVLSDCYNCAHCDYECPEVKFKGKRRGGEGKEELPP